MSVKDCTSGMDAEAFQTFTVFFTNVHTICVFVQVKLHSVILLRLREVVGLLG